MKKLLISILALLPVSSIAQTYDHQYFPQPTIYEVDQIQQATIDFENDARLGAIYYENVNENMYYGVGDGSMRSFTALQEYWIRASTSQTLTDNTDVIVNLDTGTTAVSWAAPVFQGVSLAPGFYFITAHAATNSASNGNRGADCRITADGVKIPESSMYIFMRRPQSPNGSASASFFYQVPPATQPSLQLVCSKPTTGGTTSTIADENHMTFMKIR